MNDKQDLNKLVKGYRQVMKGISAGYVGCAVIAADADKDIIRSIETLCVEKKIPYRFEPTKKGMGEQLQLDVACAVYGEIVAQKES